MTKTELEGLLEASGALRRGHFLLSSGLHSPAYVQCALLLEQPARARRVGAALAEALRSHGAESVLAPALGGILIGHEVAAALDVPFRFVERQGDELSLRRGFHLRQGERLVVVEDVVTTGKSTRETADLARAAGAEVVAIGSIIDRSGGRHGFEVPYASLLRLDFPTYEAADCPLCAAGGTAIKPGVDPPRRERPPASAGDHGLAAERLALDLVDARLERFEAPGLRGVGSGDLELPDIVRAVVDVHTPGGFLGVPTAAAGVMDAPAAGQIAADL